MTDLVYFSEIYKNYTQRGGLILDLELPIINELIQSCHPTDLFVVSTYIEKDTILEKLAEKKPKRAIVYSGMDWNDPIVREDAHNFLVENVEEVLYIGNSPGVGYFSYWLFFIKKYFPTYKLEDISPVNISYLFMNLNRKRHIHRVNLVEKLLQENLQDCGLISLGGDDTNGIDPILLPEDIVSEEGDYLVANRKEGITNDIASIGSLTNWNKHLINVVTETTIHSDTFISEKTWKPIIGLRPFMIIGDVKIYSYLKEYGIDTFDDIFGTGYLDPNFNNRVNWAIQNLKKYKDIDYSELYKSLYSRLLYNRNKMDEIFKINENRFNNVKKLLSYS